MGQAEQFRAAIRSPRSANAREKAPSRLASPSNSPIRRCGADDCPPVAISMPVAPTRAARSRAPSNDSSLTESVYSPSSTEYLLAVCEPPMAAGAFGCTDASIAPRTAPTRAVGGGRDLGQTAEGGRDGCGRGPLGRIGEG